jgi:hypothetical protein
VETLSNGARENNNEKLGVKARLPQQAKVPDSFHPTKADCFSDTACIAGRLRV